MTEEKKPFTVSDRRHFTAEGEKRPQSPEETPAPPPPEKKDSKPRTSDSLASEQPVPPRVAEYPSDSLASERQGGRVDEEPPMDFVGLLISLAAQAGMLMSPEPGSGAAPDLAGARSIIGLLEILKEKTEGRRTPDEDRVLQGLLYELRMAFVARTRPEKA
jgi:hypothetical protein